jgi:cytolysin-activating lysine-acyltransferase
MRDPSFGNLRLAELEWLLLPPLLAGQWRVARSGVEPRSAAAGPGPASGGMLVPVGVALWARVSPAVDKRLSEGLDKPLLLKAPEWSSGDINWLIATAGDGRVMPRFLKMLHEREFKGREVKLRARAKDGSLVVRTLAEHVSTL